MLSVRQCSISISNTIIWQCSSCISICDACQTVLYRYQWYYHLTVLYLYQYLWCYVRQCSISISNTIIWQCSTCISICDAMSDSALSVSVILSFDSALLVSVSVMLCQTVLYQYQWYYHLTVLYLYQYLWCYVRQCSIGISDTVIWLLYLYQYLWCYVRQCSIGISDTIIWQCSTCISICDAMSDSALSVSVILSFDSALIVSVSVMLCQTVLYRYQWYYHLTVLYLYQYLWCYVRQCSIGISDTIIWQCSTCISICDAMSDSALSVSVILSFDSALLVSVSVMLCQTVLYRYQWYYHLTVLYLYQYLWCYVRQCSISISDTIIWLLYLYRYLWYYHQTALSVSRSVSVSV